MADNWQTTLFKYIILYYEDNFRRISSFTKRTSFKSYDLVDLIIQKISKIESIDYIGKYREIIKNLKIDKFY